MIKAWVLGKCSILRKLGNRQLTQHPSKKNSSWNLHIVLGLSALCLPKLANILEIFYPSSAASPKLCCCSSDRTLPIVGAISVCNPSMLVHTRLGSPHVCTTPCRSLESSCIQSVVLMSDLCILRSRVLLQCMALATATANLSTPPHG